MSAGEIWLTERLADLDGLEADASPPDHPLWDRFCRAHDELEKQFPVTARMSTQLVCRSAGARRDPPRARRMVMDREPQASELMGYLVAPQSAAPDFGAVGISNFSTPWLRRSSGREA
jgi:hypothetical protein